MSAAPAPEGDAGAPHVPVLIEEVLEALAAREGLDVVDATFGAGGYSRRLLEAGCRVLALDRDPTAKGFAATVARLAAERFRFAAARFSELEAVLALPPEFPAPPFSAAGVVFDLGVSSMQLDTAERGFSFMRDGPLDMRMEGSGPSAADLVNTSSAEEIADILWLYGEERASRRIAAALVRRRSEAPFLTTLDLASVVERALGGRRGAPTHPATRTFQALRIAVNDELGELERGLAAAERVLPAGGRLVVVTFHSLEDRIVKSFLNERSGRLPSPSRHLPEAPSGPAPSFELLYKGARAPAPREAADNPRARSAKLRAAVRTTAPVFRRAA